MIKKYRKLKQLLIAKGKNSEITNETVKQSLGYQILQPLLLNYPYLPYNSGAIRPFNISLLLNDIIINDRKSIVEFGGGISTILISRLIKKNNLNCKLITIENDLPWQEKLSSILKSEGIEENTTIIHAPFIEVDTPFGKNNWYDIKDSLFKGKNIDLVIVDGPLASIKKLEHSRYPALPKVYKFLAENHMIYLDDTNRSGEQSIIKQWEKEFNIKFSIHNYATHISHTGFTTTPFNIF